MASPIARLFFLRPNWLTVASTVGCFFLGGALSELTLGEIPVRVVRVSESPLEGELVDFSSERLQLRFADRVLSVPSSEIEQVVPVFVGRVSREVASEQIGNENHEVALVDGTRFWVSSIEGRDDQWSCMTVSGESIDIPKRQILSLMFGTATAKQREEWASFLADEPSSSDQLMIARPSGVTDQIPGLVLGINMEAVEFSYDGQAINAPRSRLIGVRWVRPGERRFSPGITIRTSDGGAWYATSIDWSSTAAVNQGRPGNLTESGEAKVAWVLAGGMEVSYPWKKISSIDFSSSNVTWLASLPPLSTRLQTEYERGAFGQSTAPEKRMQILGPRFVSNDGGDSPRSQDLHFNVPGEMEFRVPDGAKRFVAKLVRDDESKVQSTVQCRITHGNQVVWEIELSPGATTLEIDLPVESEKRFVIQTTSDLPIAAGTAVRWSQPRFTR